MEFVLILYMLKKSNPLIVFNDCWLIVYRKEDKYGYYKRNYTKTN